MQKIITLLLVTAIAVVIPVTNASAGVTLTSDQNWPGLESPDISISYTGSLVEGQNFSIVGSGTTCAGTPNNSGQANGAEIMEDLGPRMKGGVMGRAGNTEKFETFTNHLATCAAQQHDACGDFLALSHERCDFGPHQPRFPGAGCPTGHAQPG